MSAHIYGAKPGKCKCARCEKRRAAGEIPRKSFRDMRVCDGRDVWVVSGHVTGDTVHVTEVHGDINNLTGLRNALRPLMTAGGGK